MNKFFKRLALLLAVLMIVSMMPVQLFADNSVITYVNNGTENGEDGTTTTEVASYVTVELEFGSNVSAEDIVAAKALYEGKKFDTCKAANEAYMALFGVTWKKGYLDVTDNSAPLYKYAGVSGSVAEVKYYIHGTLAGFTSLQSNGNNIDCTVGGNHQIARTSISIIGVNDENGGKAKLTDGNIQAYVAGGYINSFTASGKLTIDNIEFTSTTSTTVGASAAKDANSTQEVTSAEMEIKNCKFNGRLYVYDNFDNAGVMTYNIHDNVFDGANYNGDSNAYAIFAQCKGGNNLIIADNKISGFARGINIDHANVNATISGNKISIKDAGRSCIQLSSLTSTVISNNTLELTGGNAITLHEKLLTLTAAPKITVEGNTITGNGYLIYDDAVANNKAFTSENLTLTIGTNTVASTVDTTQGVKGSKKFGLSETVATVVDKALTPAYVATVNGVGYASLAEAIAAAPRKATVKLMANTKENVTISTPYVTLDLNGHTLNGGTEKGKPALTITARVTVMDSSEAQTGTIMREDTAENSGVSSHYVIDIQGSGWLTFESGIVKNNSGTTEGKGASLVRVGDDSVAKYPGLNIKGGTFTQDNFIVIKVDSGDLFLNGGTLNSANSYAVENWHRATIKGGTVNGTAAAWTYSGGHNSALTISGGTVNGNVLSVSYDGSTGKKASVSITGGVVNGTLMTGIYGSATEPSKEMATIEVTGGTFTKDPTKYVIEDSAITKNADGTFGVAKAYLAEVDGNKYYTMEEAFKAQTASGKPIVLLRDYTTGSTFNSGTVARVVDLNGHTWTCTGTDANSAAFEINNANASLTVKNGKIVSSQLVGLIPSAMGGTIKYDNSSLTFENVEMSTTATSGIETNGNNTNDTVTLKNSTLNVPNGFGIYFPSSGTLTVENSKITAKTMGVQVCSGVLIISGVDTAITVTGDAVPKTENDGAIQDGAAISIVNRTGYKGLDTVTISGGKFTAKEGNSAIKAYDWANKTESNFTASEKVAFSGGTFSSEVKEDLCADGFIPTKNADGTYGVKAGKYVAQIGDVKYETLAEAIAAANAGDTVTLLAEVTADVVIDKNITLDLGGKTLTNTGAGKATISVTGGTVTVKNGTVIGGTSYYNIEVTKGSNANLTLEDITATAGNTGSSMIDNWGTMTIKSGTYTGGLNVVKSEEGSTLVISGGKFELNYAVSNNYNGVILSAGTTTISGGEFIQNATTPQWGNPQVVWAQQVDGYISKIEITGGTFTNKKSGSNIFHGYGKATSDNFEVSGGTFNKSISDSYCAEGFIPTKNADGTYGVKEGMYVAKVGSKKYETLADAIRLAANGKTITLLADIEANIVILADKKNITLDLGGKTLNGGTGNTKATITNYGTITITDSSAEKTGTIKRDDNGTEGETSYYVIRNFGTMTIEQANIINNSGYKKTNPSGSMVGSSLICNGDDDAYSAVLNIKGGTIRQDNFIAIKNGSNATLNVTGGKITSKHSAVQNWCNANITGGELNGQLWTDSWDSNSTGNTVMGGDAKFTGEIVIDITGSIVPKFEIKGGTLDVTNWKITTAAANAGAKPAVSGGTFTSAVPEEYCADGFIPTQNDDGTYGVKEAMKGSEKNPYNLEELGAMTRDQYIEAQKALGGTMYVKIGNYSYDTNGVLGNGVRNDTPGQTEDRSVLNGYNSNGYLGDKNDGANGKNIIFVGGSITSGVTGYTSIDNIGTSLLLAVPAYTNVTFEGVTFNNVMSFDYQLYTGPWSQLGELKFSGCTFNGLIVGAIAAQRLTFNECTFTNYTNTTEANNSNPTWIRPAYGNWTKDDNEGQGSDFRSLTTINFTGNTVTSTRPVKFERIAQWEMDTKVTVTGNEFDIKSDGSSKNVGLYFGANAKFDLVVDNNKKTDGTAALYTAVYSAPNGTGYAGLPAGSTVKDSNGADVEVAGVIWKSTDALTLKTTTEAVKVGGVKFATLEEAFAAAKNGDTITLLEDCKSDRINLEDKSVTVVLNGKTLTSTAAYGVMFCAKNGNKITIDGTVEGSKLVGTLMITSGTDGHIEVNGGTYESNQYCPIYVNGAVSSENSTVTVKNAIIKATNSSSDQDMGCGVYLAGYSTSVFENCTITAPITGIEIRAGKLTLNNCNVTGGNGEVKKKANGNGTTVTNAALAISQHTTKKPIDVTISGGTFNGTAAVYQTDVQGTGSADVKIAVKSGTFNGTISGETDGTITISGGKFKVKVDDKYFADKLACSATPNADGYYTVKDHPIISAGISIGEDMSFRIMVEEGYENGSLKYYYIGVNGRVEGEGTIGTDTQGNSIFRIYNVNPQRADLIYVIQYYDADGNAIGAPKEISVLTYFEGFYNMEAGKNEDVEARKTFIANFLEYCASAMERSYADFPKETLDGKTWQYRADAVRAMMTRLGLKVADYEFKGNLGRYYNDNAKGNITDRGIVFGSTFRAYYEISKDIIDSGCRVFRQGTDVTDKLVLENGAYRFYFELAPYEFKDSLTITIYNGTTKVCEYSSPLANTLKAISESTNVSASKLAKAAFNYFVALQNYEG